MGLLQVSRPKEDCLVCCIVVSIELQQRPQFIQDSMNLSFCKSGLINVDTLACGPSLYGKQVTASCRAENCSPTTNTPHEAQQTPVGSTPLQAKSADSAVMAHLPREVEDPGVEEWQVVVVWGVVG